MDCSKGEVIITPAESFELQMLKKLSRGEFKIRVKYKDIGCEGYVHLLDFAKGAEYFHAFVAITDPYTKESVAIEVNIFIDGRNGRDIDIDVLPGAKEVTIFAD